MIQLRAAQLYPSATAQAEQDATRKWAGGTEKNTPMTPMHITKGKAVFTSDGLRCRAPRDKDPERACNKLLVRKNSSGQVAGSFQCERCRQKVEVEISK